MVFGCLYFKKLFKFVSNLYSSFIIFLRITLHTPFHIFIFHSQRKIETRDKTRFRVQILIFVSYFYSSFIIFLRITFHTPFLFLYFILRGREKQETKQTPRLQKLIFVSYFYSSFIDFYESHCNPLSYFI